jgi:hypothetical protein
MVEKFSYRFWPFSSLVLWHLLLAVLVRVRRDDPAPCRPCFRVRLRVVALAPRCLQCCDIRPVSLASQVFLKLVLATWVSLADSAAPLPEWLLLHDR